MKSEIGNSVKAHLKAFSEAFQKAFDIALPDSLCGGLSDNHRDIADIETEDIETETEGRGSNRSQARCKKPDLKLWLKQDFKPRYPAHRQVQEKTALAKLGEIDPGPERCLAILTQLEKWKASHEWAKDGGIYVPGMGKFFSDGYYERDPAEHVNGSRRLGATPQNGGADRPAIPNFEELLERDRAKGTAAL